MKNNLYRGISRFNLDTLKYSAILDTRGKKYINTTNNLNLAKEYGSIVIEYAPIEEDNMKIVDIENRKMDINNYDRELTKNNYDGVVVQLGGPGVKHIRVKRSKLKLKKVHIFPGADENIVNEMKKLHIV